MITGLTVASHPQRCFLVAVKISTYKEKSHLQNGDRNFPARHFNSLTFFAGLCIGITPVAQALLPKGKLTRDDTLVVEASTPSLYAPQQSADPKFSRPVADNTTHYDGDFCNK